MRSDRTLDDLRRAGTPSTFRDFMDAALNDPAEGYYGSGRVRFGSRGDFSTSSTIHSVFAEVIAACLVDAWEALGRPTDFTVVEVGPGDGWLARTVLELQTRSAPADFALRYVLVEQSNALAGRQQMAVDGGEWPVEWTSLDRLAQPPVTGLIFSNELVDALPVHRARVRAGCVEEQFVVWDGSRWLSQWAQPSSPKLAAYVARHAPAFLEHESSPELEVGLDAVRWMRHAAAALSRGFLVTIDYGDLAERLYTCARPEGTIRAFRDHQLTADPFDDPGSRDLTAHVNFSALVDAGTESGLTTLAFETQRAFCERYGLAERIARRAANATLEDRLAMKSLLAPAGPAEAMRVLVQAKMPLPTNDFPKSPI